MATVWTEEQQKVIDLENRNILVSAAAGSGKTAVLVERIMRKLTDKHRPTDIDRLLIVTFTKAAAGEMRERIGAAIQRRLLDEPENEHLLRQETLLFHAQITTIDSFCQSVVRNHFHTIDLDPTFSVADEGERELLLQDAAKELLEEKYADPSEAFLAFAECFAPGKQDDGLEELIRALFLSAQSHPYPDEWLMHCGEAYALSSLQELEDAPWMRKLCVQVHKILESLLETTEQTLCLARSSGGPYMYEDALLCDREMLAGMLQETTYAGLSEVFRLLEFQKLGGKSDASVLADKRSRAKEMRDYVKDALTDLKDRYFYSTPEKLLEDMQRMRVPAGELFALTRAFAERYDAKKREKNLVDFADLEHMALKILVRRENGKTFPTEAALSYARQFDEILIDEYQDSNLVQELILTSVSRCGGGVNNMFMVGDVKQSIYRFRQAMPELFMQKYDDYTQEDSPCQKIELHKNFRSRSEVLCDVNFIFRKIMRRSLGNVEYDDRAALYAGAQFPALESNVETAFLHARQSPLRGAEVLLLDLDGGEELLRKRRENADEAEARMIGGQIERLVGRELVYDRRIECYRPVRYRDVAVLLRSVAGRAEAYQKVFEDMGIPAYTGVGSGYFSASEVQTVLSLLKIMDNPRQEIPFAAVLTSPIGGLTTEELARIRTAFRDVPFYEACRFYAQERDFGDEASRILQKKLGAFFEMLSEFRDMVPYTPMHELLWNILERTGYMDYASAMPAGGQRRANLEMLIEKAAAYERTSYRGLFNFVRYIEHIQKYEVDFGEAEMIGEAEDAVRIMSVHKSKGLEFPIVFAVGLGRGFNRQDSKDVLAIHPEFGVGCDSVDPLFRVKRPTLLKRMIQRQIFYENLGEELRVLYVALTRAKEKLYMTAAFKNLTKELEKWRSEEKKERLNFLELSGAGSAAAWILQALFSEGEGNPPPIACTPVTVQELAYSEEKTHRDGRVWKERLLAGEMTDEEGVKALWDWLGQSTGERYPREASLGVKAKVSVSELKRQSQRVDMEEAENWYSEPEVVPLIPNFLQKSEKSGAYRGTALHHVMQRLDFTGEATVPEVTGQIEKLVSRGVVTQEEADAVSVPGIVHFLRTDLGRRAAAAMRRGRLHRETQFVISVNVQEFDPRQDADENVLVQGIIDLWFEEDGKIILADYKTDRTAAGSEADLAAKYRTQLDCYARALEQLTGEPVAEKLLYSFSLQKEIAI